MNTQKNQVIDVHVHVGLKGDKWRELGHFSETYQNELVYEIFLLYAHIKKEDVTDIKLREKILEIIEHSGLDKVVCLALDHVFDLKGKPEPGLSHMWVSNEYILDLKRELPEKVEFGASVHPYDDNFLTRVKKCVDDGAVLLKWLPSAQQIDLAEEKSRKALIALAKAGPGNTPLPLLLHVGPEYAVHSTDERTKPYDFLSWTLMDKLANFFRFKKRWYTPNIKRIYENLNAALDEGAIIIFAHCGLPYYFSGLLGKILEHSDFKSVKKYLLNTVENKFRGKCYADVSAICTPFRKAYFKKIEKLPPHLLLYGSDIPTPVFELSADIKENWEDFKAILKGDFSRIIIPQDNLLDVNYTELKYYFPGHPMFTNFSSLMK
ncbi:MAG: hypothetical protein WBC02_10035 [Candidatus Aminicenantaceae bacterium]